MFAHSGKFLCLIVCLISATCATTGCSGPGAIVDGKANNNQFVDSGETDEFGNEIPKGLSPLN